LEISKLGPIPPIPHPPSMKHLVWRYPPETAPLDIITGTMKGQAEAGASGFLTSSGGSACSLSVKAAGPGFYPSNKETGGLFYGRFD
jgi:hypothetical protein